MSDIKPLKKKKVRLADLHVRYIPVVTPIELWDHDMSLVNSPHVELMMTFLHHGYDKKKIKSSRYFAERRHRRKVGLTKWTDTKIWEHIHVRYEIFRSIRKRGFSTKICRRDPVKVLSQPFWMTRFGSDLPWLKGLEVWNGMGRCAAAYVLGVQAVTVQMCRDARPGSGNKGKFGNKLIRVKGVWND